MRSRLYTRLGALISYSGLKAAHQEVGHARVVFHPPGCGSCGALRWRGVAGDGVGCGGTVQQRQRDANHGALLRHARLATAMQVSFFMFFLYRD